MTKLGKHNHRHSKPLLLGTAKVGERGQIVIPKEARDKFKIQSGDTLIILGDEEKQGIALVKSDLMESFALNILERIGYFKRDETEGS